jgi:phenylacetate-CoA ligase
VHLNEDEYICEVLEPGGERPLDDGEQGELVITNLGRTASPLIRYRTGDVVVRRSGRCACGRSFAWLAGGILARVDDMVNVRGVNVYPSAVEAVVRAFPEIAEFRAKVASTGSLKELSLEIELMPGVGDAAAVARLRDSLRASLGLTVPVTVVERGVLPRFELKSRRLVTDVD